MIELGPFISKSGKKYVFAFVPEEKIVYAIGSLHDVVGEVSSAHPDAFQANAESVDEAKKKINEAIEHGILK